VVESHGMDSMAAQQASLGQRTAALREQFHTLYPNAQPPTVVRAPGRVNLIGEHTDYNDGFVLPAAIDRDTLVAVAPRDDQMVHVTSLNIERASSFDLNSIIPATGPQRWNNYVRGIAYMLQRDGRQLRGADMALISTVPVASGLSSSAALEVGTGYAFLHLAGAEHIDKSALALLCQRAENEFVGVNCGIMDQFISALGKAGNALFVDCRSLDMRHVPLVDNEAVIIITDSQVARGLASSEYNVRRGECEEGVRLLQPVLPGIIALRDVSVEQFKQYEGLLPPIVRRRCRHVVGENARVLTATEVLSEGNLVRFGELMNQSHNSLRDDYAVSCPELDLLVDAAREVPGVLGSRMTGAGFGGCTVSLVRRDAVDAFQRHVTQVYEAKTTTTPPMYVTTATDGVGIVDA